MIDPSVETQMLVRRPIDEVFNAFVDPSITTRFWFTKSSGRLEPGARVTWAWEIYGVSTDVLVREIEPPSRILIEWDDPATTVEWRFTSHGTEATLVQISNAGFQGTEEKIVAMALDSMGGFSLVLAALKAWLEHGIALNLVADRAPDHHVSH
ncbi:MAG: polyketide cyclase [Gemmatimonadetes bacterium]|nr:polyketide cyclase [Gemmatimonadota bacterium]MYH19608.1 polyketide cyclase [Gemmatimonadota bacterium]MYK97345.1 polyketide cyclase [Gemmatimonadota bacterium]